MAPRLREIARMAGVSEATVSRVVNQRPGVSTDTRLVVRRAIDELGYRKQRNRLGTAGLIMPELDNPIFPAFAQAIGSALTREGYATILCTLGAHVEEDEYVSMLLERGVDGIVFVCGMHANADTDRARYSALRQRGVPLVFVNGTMEGFDAPFISVDDTVASELAVRHLASLGHTRIGLAVGPRRFVPAARKITGYLRAMTAVAAEASEDLILDGIYWFEGAGFALDTLLDRGATALVCGSDMMALGAIAAARRHGLDVPRDISIVGFDDIPLAGFTDPALTTVAQPIQAMGSATVRALLEQVQDGSIHTGEFMFRPNLVVRSSTGAVPVRARGEGTAAG